MSKVYLGRDERYKRDVAIKVVASCPPHGLREARALQRLSNPHVATIYDFITQPQREFIVMEFVPGATLKDVVAAGPLPSAEVLRLGKQMACGLAAAHAAHVLHRDIKPGNIKVTSAGELKILDFGVAKLLPSAAAVETGTDTPTGLGPIGTLPYMSPEQLRGEPLDERSDIFSAGAVLYEMASGRPAFPQRKLVNLVEAILHRGPVSLAAVNPLVPPALERVVMKAMEMDPRDRQQSAAQLADELDGVAAVLEVCAGDRQRWSGIQSWNDER
jgi:serine/threonine protein kinase